MGTGQFSLARLFIATALVAVGFGMLQIVWYAPNGLWLVLPAVLASCCFGVAAEVLAKNLTVGIYATGFAAVMVLLNTWRAVE